MELQIINSLDAREARAFASGAVDSDLTSTLVKPVALKLAFTASVLDARHYGDSVQNEPSSLLVALLGKALSGIPPLGVVDKWPVTSTLIAFLS